MTATYRKILAAGGAAALLLAAGYFTRERARNARAARLDWRDIEVISAARGPAAAARALEVRLAAHPRDAMLHYYRARLYYQEGRAAEALQAADRAISLGYAQEVSHVLKALVVGRLRGDRGAQKALASKALVYDPAYDEAFLVRAEAEHRLGEYGACARDAAAYSGLAPGEAYGYELAQLCLEGLRDYDGAAKAGLRLLALDPGNHAALWRLGNIEAARGRHRDALERFSEAIRLSGGEARYYLDRAASCSELGDYICEAWDRASALEWEGVSRYATHYMALGAAMHRAGEPEAGLKAAEKALALSPSEAGALELRGRLRAEISARNR